MQAAAHCGFNVGTFLAWVRHRFLPAADADTRCWTNAALNEALDRVMRLGVQSDNPSRRHSNFKTIPNVQRLWKKLQQGEGAGHWLFYFRPTSERLLGPWGGPQFMAALIDCERRYAAQQANQTAANPLPQQPQNPLPSAARPSHSAPPPAPKSVTQKEALPTTEGFSPPLAPVFLTPEELTERWRGQVASETLSNWRSAGVGPRATKIGKAILYRIDLVEEWEQQQLFRKPKS